MKSFSVWFLVILIVSVFSSCKKEEIPPEENLSRFQLQTIQYFKDVALGFEAGNSSRITRKWISDMKIFIDGNPSDTVMTMIEETNAQLNELPTDGFEIEIVDNQLTSNTYFFLGSASEYTELFPDAEEILGSDLGTFYVWWNNSRINEARIFVDTDRTNLRQQRSLIMEEITQSLGLGRDSPRYPNSIFYESQSMGGFATEFAPIDQELIRLLYHPEMEIGINANQVDVVLRRIFENE